MVYTFLVIIAASFFAATVVLGVLLLEAYTSRGARTIIRQWRIAFSKRRQINEALSYAKQCTENVATAKREIAATNIRAGDIEKKAASRVARMGSFIIAEQCGEQIKGIKANNYHARESKILRSIEVAAKNGYQLPKDERDQLARMLKQAHESAIRAEKEREKQAEIKAQIREEEKRAREIDRAIKEAERERKFKEAALREAIRLLGDTHSAEVDLLRAELAEAEAKAARTISMAQQTRAGHIYIISNIGSFGKNVFKVGMTRRLEPMDRINELGDASVPFSFDVHAMISSDDAPKLEAELHQDLDKCRVNRVNYRKEFFRTDLETIITHVRNRHGDIEYEADAEALEYLESIAIDNDEGPVEKLIDRESEMAEIP